MNPILLRWVLKVARHGRMVPNGHHHELEAIAHLAVAQLRTLKGGVA